MSKDNFQWTDELVIEFCNWFTRLPINEVYKTDRIQEFKQSHTKRERMTDILNAKICPYCGQKPEFVDSSIVYGPDTHYGMIWHCKSCNAYVGVHKGSNIPLGRLANAELRAAKKRAHYYFDQIAKTSLINKVWPKYIPNLGNRNKAYLWLSNQLGIKREECHIGMFEIDQCNKVIELCKPFLPNDIEDIFKFKFNKPPLT